MYIYSQVNCSRDMWRINGISFLIYCLNSFCVGGSIYKKMHIAKSDSFGESDSFAKI